jgi:hypothetical protein
MKALFLNTNKIIENEYRRNNQTEPRNYSRCALSLNSWEEMSWDQ